MHILFYASATIAIDAFVGTLLCHPEVVTLFRLPDPFYGVVEFNCVHLRFLSFLQELVGINPTADDIRVSIEDAISFTRRNESSHICWDSLLVVVRLLQVLMREWRILRPGLDFSVADRARSLLIVVEISLEFSVRDVPVQGHHGLYNAAVKG